MQFLTSVLFGCPGHYNILGICVTFQKTEHSSPNSIQSSETSALTSQSSSKIFNRIQWIIQSSFRFLFLHYARTFVHEMSHALADTLFNLKSQVFIFTHQSQGLLQRQTSGQTITYNLYTLPKWKLTVHYSAGYVGSVTFSTFIIIMTAGVKKYLFRNVFILLQGIFIIQVIEEGIMHPLISAYRQDNGDFGLVAKNCGNTHLALAMAAVAMQTALTILVWFKAVTSKGGR